MDGDFNSHDLIAVRARGQYEDHEYRNSSWAEGDGNGNEDFTSADLIVAMADGGYEQGPAASAASVPEPSCLG
jgi:hypothetical protein